MQIASVFAGQGAAGEGPHGGPQEGSRTEMAGKKMKYHPRRSAPPCICTALCTCEWARGMSCYLLFHLGYLTYPAISVKNFHQKTRFRPIRLPHQPRCLLMAPRPEITSGNSEPRGPGAETLSRAPEAMPGPGGPRSYSQAVIWKGTTILRARCNHYPETGRNARLADPGQSGISCHIKSSAAFCLAGHRDPVR
jgi:hypothetical protein